MKLFQVEIERNELNKDKKKSTLTKKNIIRLRNRERKHSKQRQIPLKFIWIIGHKIADKGCLSQKQQQFIVRKQKSKAKRYLLFEITSIRRTLTIHRYTKLKRYTDRENIQNCIGGYCQNPTTLTTNQIDRERQDSNNYVKRV